MPSQFELEFEKQNNSGSRNYAALATALGELVLTKGKIPAADFEIVLRILGEPRVYSDDSLHELMLDLWALPDAISKDQKIAIVQRLLVAPLEEITQENIYVVGDILMKLSEREHINDMVDALEKSAAPRSLIEFLRDSIELNIGLPEN